MATRIVIAGPPCAGKTTYARTLDLPVYDLDAIAVSIGSPRSHNHDDALYRRAGGILRHRAERLGSGTRHGVVIRAAPDGRDRQAWADRISSPDSVARVMVLIPPMDVLMERAQDRAPYHRVTEAAIRGWMSRYTRHPGHVVVGTEPVPGSHAAGKDPLAQQVYTDARWKATSLAARERDGYQCTRCGNGGRVEADHVVRPQDGGHPWDLANVVTLCQRCHKQKTARQKAQREGRAPAPHVATQCDQCRKGMHWDGYMHTSSAW